MVTATTCLLAVLAGGGPGIGKARPVPADGVLRAAGHYFLSHDLLTDRHPAIRIEADHVTLDLRGHAVRYRGKPRPGVLGIVVRDRREIRIHNGQIGGFWFNVHCGNVRGLTLEKLDFASIAYVGIHAGGCRQVRIRGNRFHGFQFDLAKPKDKYLIAINIGAESALISENRFEADPGKVEVSKRGIETVFILFSARVSQRCVATHNTLVATQPLPRSYGVWIASESEVSVLHNRFLNLQYAVAVASQADAQVLRNSVRVTSAKEFASAGIRALRARQVIVGHNRFQGVADPLRLPMKAPALSPAKEAAKAKEKRGTKKQAPRDQVP